MNISRNQLLIAAAAILVAVGGFFAFTGFTDNNQSSQQTQEGQTAPGEPSFNPFATEGVEYVATISGSSEDGDISGTIEADGDGSMLYRFSDEGEETQMYITPEGTYVCQAESDCIRFSSSNDDEAIADSPFNPERFSYDEEDYQEFRDLTVYQGQEECNGATCDVWTYTDEETNIDTTIYINSSNDRVVRIESREDNSNFVIEYDYDVNVTITPPENFQELPDFSDMQQ